MTSHTTIARYTWLACSLLILFTLTGCAHLGQSASNSNYQSFLDAEQRWFDLLFADDMEGALEMVSENYGSESYGNKAALAKYMKLIQGSKMLTPETLDRSKVVIEFNDTTASAGPYMLNAHGFNFSFSLDYQLEGDDWRIVGMNWAKE